MKPEQLRQHISPDPESVAKETAKRIISIADDAIQRRGKFHLVLSGGNTPRQTYKQLSNTNADWQHWYIYFGDERCLPANNKERNSVMAKQAWLDHVAIPPDQIYEIPAELGAEEAATVYAGIIEPAMPFDLVLLGMGEDGHTASLFPGQKHDPDELVHAIHQAPKPPPDRLSLSVKSLNQSRHVIIQITGTNKREALKKWFTGDDLPIAQIQSINGIDLMMDEAAINWSRP